MNNFIELTFIHNDMSSYRALVNISEIVYVWDKKFEKTIVTEIITKDGNQYTTLETYEEIMGLLKPQ